MGNQIGKGLVVSCAIVLVLGAFASPCPAYLKSKADWNEYQSEHFLIHSHPAIPNKYIRKFTSRCEHYYHLIAKRLGFSRFAFRAREDKPRIFMYKQRQDFLKGLSQERAINTFYFEKDFFDKTFPRRISSIILREFIGPGVELPLWFEQGVAYANEKDSALKYLLLAKTNYSYARAASRVIFLLEDYGSESFVRFCRYLRQGDAFYEAMDEVYNIQDEKGLDAGLRDFLENKN